MGSNYKGDHTPQPSLDGLFYGVLEWRVRLIAEPWILELVFVLATGPLLYPWECTKGEGPWQFAQPVHMCFVDLSPKVSSGSMG